MSIIFQSPSMRQLLVCAQRFAASSATVLIGGESGTGKELLARYLHEESGRHRQPYVRINCAAFSSSLLESELFGHEQGAFTGAIRRRQGCLEVAADGTLFLDEISELPLTAQAKLLRVLEENEFHRVGSHELLTVRARIIAATNRNLRQEVTAGRFREDLFHRLDVLTLDIPPLRDRRQDIPVLVDHFLQQFRTECHSCVRAVSAQVLEQLNRHNWPGNVRELRNVVQRACIMADCEILQDIGLHQQEPQILPLSVAASPLSEFSSDWDELSLKEIERSIILRRLERFDGNRSQAAKSLGVTSRTLRNKLAAWRDLKKAG